MQQQELIIDTKDESTAIAVAPLTDPLRGDFADLRHAMISLPVEQQKLMLTELKARRDYFREWLMSQLIKGVHYGYPPGCEAELNENGDMIVKVKGVEKVVPKEQWKKKPTFYAAGADFVAEIMGLRDEYSADMESWEQLGKPEMTYVRKCKLFSRATGEFVGEGTGGRKVSQNEGKVNDAVKMADKNAKVAAVINTYGLRDLFVQESEDTAPPPNGTPQQKQDAPKTKTRGERVDSNAIVALHKRWESYQEADRRTRQHWFRFIEEQTGEHVDYSASINWTKERYMKVSRAIDVLDGGAPQ